MFSKMNSIVSFGSRGEHKVVWWGLVLSMLKVLNYWIWWINMCKF